MSGPLVEREIDDVRDKWGTATELDADVLRSIRPYVKLWVAV
ncbi:hypothetical protein P3H80_01135 [Mycolicibacterium septicum]|nr:hypothetical protein [Mycolicibacterium septicum]MDF3336002.1 hypothetical protein [Mycolicibacterium septicum]